MFEVDDVLSWRVREKRARQRLTGTIAANQIGISRRTLSLIELGKKEVITKTVYQKVINWLLKECEVK